MLLMSYLVHVIVELIPQTIHHRLEQGLNKIIFAHLQNVYCPIILVLIPVSQLLGCKLLKICHYI